MFEKKSSQNEFIVNNIANGKVCWSSRHSHCCIYIEGNIIVLGGFDAENGSLNDVWTSKDGKVWQELRNAPWSLRDGHKAVVKDNSIFVIGGTGQYQEDMQVMNDVWRSDDCGESWMIISKDCQWCGRWQHGLVSLNKSLIVIGGWGAQEKGYLSDVWGSKDGKEWTLLCASGPFGPRAMHAVVVHENALYVIGGFNGTRSLGDVWASTNGKRWTRICHNAPWLPRHGHCVVSCEGWLYVMGGVDGGVGEGVGSLNDVWRSRDGALWELVFVEAPWNPRNNHSVIVVEHLKESNSRSNSCMYVVGGMDLMEEKGDSSQSSTQFFNDVWSLQFKPLLPSASPSNSSIYQHHQNSMVFNPCDDDTQLNISMQAVTSTVVELLRSRQVLYDVVRKNQELIEVINKAANFNSPSYVPQTSTKTPELFIPPSPSSSVCSPTRNNFSSASVARPRIKSKSGSVDGMKLPWLASSVSVESELGDLSDFQDALESDQETLPDVIFSGGNRSRTSSGSQPIKEVSSQDDDTRSDKKEWWWWLVGGANEAFSNVDENIEDNFLEQDEKPKVMFMPSNRVDMRSESDSSANEKQESNQGLLQMPPPLPPPPLPPPADPASSPPPLESLSFNVPLPVESSTSNETYDASVISRPVSSSSEINTKLMLNRIISERKQLKTLQDSIFHCALSISNTHHDHSNNRMRTQSDEGTELETLLIQRHEFVVKALLALENDMVLLRSTSAKPKVWLNGLSVARGHILKFIETSTDNANEKDPRSKMRRQQIEIKNKSRADDDEDDNDGGVGSGNDDGVGPWSTSEKSASKLSSSLTFHEAVMEIRTLTTAPLEPSSLKNNTDDAIRRLAECLDLRARAATGMIPSTTKPMSSEAAAEALAWAQLWDGGEVLSKLKLLVHTSAGLELKKLPLVLDQAMLLQSKLLPASLSYLEILEHEIRDKVSDGSQAECELESWGLHLRELADRDVVKQTKSMTLNQSTMNQVQTVFEGNEETIPFSHGGSIEGNGKLVVLGCNKIRDAVEHYVNRSEVLYDEIEALEDEEIDARSAFEKAFRRRKSPSANMMLRNSNSSRSMLVQQPSRTSQKAYSLDTTSALSVSASSISLQSLVSTDEMMIGQNGNISPNNSQFQTSTPPPSPPTLQSNASYPVPQRTLKSARSMHDNGATFSEIQQANDSILISLQEKLSNIVSRAHIVKRRLKNTLSRAARFARLLAPEMIAYMPSLVDLKTGKIKLVISNQEFDDEDDDDGQNVSDEKRGPGGLLWKSLKNYSQFQPYSASTLIPLRVDNKETPSHGKYSALDGQNEDGDHGVVRAGMQRQLSSGTMDALNKSLATSRKKQPHMIQNEKIDEIEEGNQWKNKKDMKRIKKKRPTCVNTCTVSDDEVNDWLFTAFRDGQRVLLKGYGARDFGSLSFGGGGSSGNLFHQGGDDTTSERSTSTSSTSSASSSGGPLPRKLRSETEDEDMYGENEDEEEFELERLLGMPPHEAIAGPTAIIDAYDDDSLISSLFHKNNEDQNDEDQKLRIPNMASTYPLFYLELPFPHPESTLIDWVLYPGRRDERISPSSSSSSSMDVRQTPRSIAKTVRKDTTKPKNANTRNERSPWELQHMARHILAIIAAMHGAGRAHGALHPTAIEIEEGSERVRVKVLPTCLLRFSKEYLAPELLNKPSSNFYLRKESSLDSPDINAASTNQQRIWGTKSGLSVLRNSGQLQAVTTQHEVSGAFAADMFAFGVLLHWMVLPEAPAPVPGALNLPSFLDVNLRSLLTKLLSTDPIKRPSASDAILHPYLTASFSDRLVASGELLHQDEKLEAVRELIKQVKYDHRASKETITVHRYAPIKESNSSEKKSMNSDDYINLVFDVLAHFEERGNAKKRLRVNFVGEAGTDEGGLCTEMFRLFFEGLVSSKVGLFKCSSSFQQDDGDNGGGGGGVYLPKSGVLTAQEERQMKAVGRIIVKCFYEGKRVGSRFAPSLYKYLAHGKEFKHAKKLEPRALDDLKIFDPEMGSSLEWILQHKGVDDLGLDFDELPNQTSCAVTDLNKNDFVRKKVRYVLLESRLCSLEALRAGFWESMLELSPEATPFLKLLSMTDWSLLLCGEDDLTPKAVNSILKFNGYSFNSKIPIWLPQTIEQFSSDNLRRFLIFCTGSPSLPPSSTKDMEITVQYVSGVEALPVAHTCFFKLDLPNYNDQTVFVEKLMKAIQECGTFDRV